MKRILLVFFLFLNGTYSQVFASQSSCLAFYQNTFRDANRKDFLTLNSGHSAVQTMTRKGQVFKLINLRELSPESSDYQAADNYLKGLFAEALKRLNLSEAIVNAIEKDNPVLVSQSHFLLMYDVDNPEHVIGGAAFVMAKDDKSTMAFQRELNLDPSDKILDDLYPKAEVARVSIDTSRPFYSEKFRILIETIMDVVTSSPEIRSFYTFTSRRHQRLYGLFGFTGTKMADSNSLEKIPRNDVILRINVP
jgi:hypothetical protein